LKGEYNMFVKDTDGNMYVRTLDKRIIQLITKYLGGNIYGFVVFDHPEEDEVELTQLTKAEEKEFN
jgi:hypothetical protein